MRMAETWVQSTEDELPERFGDLELENFRTICSNGFEGPVTIASVFIHKPSRWPQCFPFGEDGDCSCTIEIVRRVSTD